MGVIAALPDFAMPNGVAAASVMSPLRAAFAAPPGGGVPGRAEGLRAVACGDGDLEGWADLGIAADADGELGRAGDTSLSRFSEEAFAEASCSGTLLAASAFVGDFGTGTAASSWAGAETGEA